ncbi:TetR/AcrR family transcriptional regulator [Kibdelosporangium persicum]|uniref:HTH-type transcriptional regulator BetI n=1 Tax=Kibdelosporangium persicum TaxID=2698649 RepID=A0ABX2FB32_9PSEU|nr:TetR/AcrR family transcriptional regulator [Kibdelosporangium persicum]NRN67965.1 HTH-type transcriptional regulator BetI [Kibdelosporangium persicum]
MPESTARTRRTQQERRARAESALLAAAAELVAESGTRALTLASVGERAGYSRGIVNHHFGSIPSLLEVLARQVQDQLVPEWDELPPGLERLLFILERYLDTVATGAPITRAFFVMWAESVTRPELAAIFRERDQAFRASIAADVVLGIENGSVRPDLDPHDTAVAIVGDLRGIAIQWLLDRDSADLRRLRKALPELWRRALAA